MDWTKILTTVVALPSIVRVLVPGALTAWLVRPFAPAFLDPFTILGITGEQAVPRIVVLLGLWSVLGLPVAALTSPFYEVLEGRRLWPRPLYRAFTALQGWRVKRLYQKAESTDDQQLRKELWSRLRPYPLDDEGRPCATHPTKLGNVLAGYEAYPLTRYGMDPVFYWPRIWMQVDAGKKKEIDSSWAVADGLVGMTGVSLLTAVAWLLVALAAWVAGYPPASALLAGALDALPTWVVAGRSGAELLATGLRELPASGSSAAAARNAALAWLLGWLLYRLSLPFHRANGELFKSVFDLYRDKLTPMTEAGPEVREVWRRVWLYLQYHQVECGACGGSHDADARECPDCGAIRRRTRPAPPGK